MYKFTNKILLGAVGLLFTTNLAFGIDAEFKNSLVKVELKKAQDGLYSVDLYTKTQYLEPVKVIKKSDLNYYILLPETKNETVRTTSAGTEIRSVSTNLFQYAGEAANNGYVKIDINTTKPLNFKVNIKDINSLQTSQQAQEKVAQVAPETKTETLSENSQVEKKNSDFSNSKKEKLEKENLKNDAKQNKKEKELPQVKIEDVVKQEVNRVRQEQIELLEEIEQNNKDIIAQNEDEEAILSDEDIAQLEAIAKDEKTKVDFSYIAKTKLLELKIKASNFLARFGINLTDFVLTSVMVILGLLFILVLLFARRTPRKISSNEVYAQENGNKRPNIVNKKEEVKNDGQYFVFDGNVKQTGFCDPATSAIKRNYELSSYEPELKNKYSRNDNTFAKHTSKRPESEYDIIQKILKEDTFIDIPAQAYAQVPLKPQAEPVVEEVKKEEIPQIVQEEEPLKPLEPTVLSSVEVAPQRGFMCVSYKDTIRLLGYIFDDVFALYNFKTPKLQNYDIKYRLSEKDDGLARFIVKVDDTKMLVRVTKSAMDMEVLL